MLKYYSYYNVGGYKDMFLGDSTMNDTATYFFPLLSVWKKRAADGDVDCAERLKGLDGLPKIQILTAEANYGLPAMADIMISHGGYKILNVVSDKGESIFAIRDVESRSYDESGRSIPFTFLIVGDTAEDMKVLEKVAAYAASHLETFSEELAAYFFYEAKKNGIAFNLSSMTKLIGRIVSINGNTIPVLKGEFAVRSKAGEVSLLLLPDGITKDRAVREQNLTNKKVKMIEREDVIPLDNQQHMLNSLQRIQQAKNAILTDKRILWLIGGAFVMGFIIGCLVCKL